MIELRWLTRECLEAGLSRATTLQYRTQTKITTTNVYSTESVARVDYEWTDWMDVPSETELIKL